MSVKIKNVPKGFHFPLSKKDLKDLRNSFPDMLSEIVFENISYSEGFKFNNSSWCVGIITAYRTENKWQFSLEINALRDEHILDIKDKVSVLLLDEIRNWITKKSSLPLTAPEEPRQLFLRFNREGTFVVAASFECRKDK